MKITLDIPKEQLGFFLELLKKFNFEIKLEATQEDIPDWHKEILDERLAKYESNTEGFVLWEDLKKNIEKQL
jgi:hypothetical protein